MKTVKDITNLINFPKFKDTFGNEIIPGDIIALTSTQTKHIDTCLVTDQKTKGNNIILIDIMNDRHSKVYFDPEEVSEDNKSHWYTTNIIKVNNCLPDYLKDTVEKLKVKFVQDNINRANQIIENRKNAIQVRYFPVFTYNKNTNQAGVIFAYIQSQPGKVISKIDLLNMQSYLIQKYPDYKLDFIDKDGALCPINDKKFKPDLHNLKQHYYFCKTSGIKFRYHGATDLYYWEASQEYNKEKLFNINIPIYTKEQAEEKHLELYKNSNYSEDFGINQYNYRIQCTKFRNNNKIVVRNLGEVFSTDAINKFHAFYNYYVR